MRKRVGFVLALLCLPALIALYVLLVPVAFVAECVTAYKMRGHDFRQTCGCVRCHQQRLRWEAGRKHA